MNAKANGNSRKNCIYCGGNEDMTVDHIPPKGMFPEPRPSNMLTVPCCMKCNQCFSKDDEYFRTVLVNNASVVSDPNAQAVNEKFLRSLHRKGATSCFFGKYFHATSLATSASRSRRAAVMICCPRGVTR